MNILLGLDLNFDSSSATLRSNASGGWKMNQGKLVFAQLTEHLPLTTFRRCVARHRGEFKVRSFSCLDQFLCMANATDSKVLCASLKTTPDRLVSIPCRPPTLRRPDTRFGNASRLSSLHNDRYALTAVVAVASEVPLLFHRLHIAFRIGGTYAENVRAASGVPAKCPRPPGIRRVRLAQLRLGPRRIPSTLLPRGSTPMLCR